MKRLSFIIILVIICFVQFAFGQSEDLNVNWKRITDKDYVVKLVKIQYDTTSSEAIITKKYSFDLDNSAKTLSKNNVKQLQKFISDSNNFGDEIEDPDCGITKFTNAFVVLRRGNIVGIIRLSCDNNFWVFAPKTKDIISVLVSDEGKETKTKIFSELK